MSTKNLGQVAGLWIGNSAPTNTTLIWFDNTPAIRCHKVYDEALGAWKVLSPNTISSITYSELRNLAQGTGLTQGSWYKITDRGNALALAITTTKVQYTDANGNFVIDDLASSSVYVVTSSNLLIDDIRGAWDAVNKRLEFNFTETAQDENSGNDFLFGKKQRAGIWSFAKYKLSQLVSSVTGNSISWNRGIFFNFNSAINSQKDVAGGVVGKDAYDIDIANMQQSIDNAAADIQSALATAKNYTDSEVTATKIYNKQLPTAPTAGTATEIAQNDTLTLIITKIQRWIWQLKAGDGIQVTSTGMVEPEEGNIWPTDTIFTAIKKLLYKVTHIGTTNIVDGAVITAKIADGAVTEDKLGYGAVITTKLSDGAVTSTKIADNVISSNKFVNNSVIADKIANGAVVMSKLEDMLLPQIYYGGYAVTTQGGSVEVGDLCSIQTTVAGRLWGCKSINMDNNTSLSITTDGPNSGGYPNFPLVL